MASKLHGTDFLDKLPVVHIVGIFLECYGTYLVTNKPTQKHATARTTLSTERCTSRVLSLVTLHVIASTVSANYKRFLPPQPTQRLLE
jgi:hypothetical protein